MMEITGVDSRGSAFILILFLLFSWSPQAAEPETALELKQKCTAAEGAVKSNDRFRSSAKILLDTSDCVTFFKRFEIARNLAEQDGSVCVPGGVSRYQVEDAFLWFVFEEPNRLKMPADKAVNAALVEAFPCKAGKAD